MIRGNDNPSGGEPDSTRDIEWLAVQYILGELSPGDVEAFEARLDDDQSARNSLVLATRLVTALAATPAVTVPRRPTFLWRTAAVLTATAAAAVVGVFLLRGEVSDVRRLVADDVDPARLVVLWSASGDLLNGTDGDGDDPTGTDSDTALLPPDWMLAAVEQDAILLPLESPLDPDGDEIERN